MENKKGFATKRKSVTEWVLIMDKGDDIILTESQYKLYKQRTVDDDERVIFFNGLGFNPFHVVSFFERPALIIKKKYPCRQCGTVGYNEDKTDWCKRCGGSGVDLPVKK